MRAALLRRFGGPEVLEVADLPEPEIGPEEMRVRVNACGVCGHDLLSRAGRLGGDLPRVLGHEITGTVEETGSSVAGFATGDRVVLCQRRVCGRCTACRSGHPNRCTRGAGFYGEDLPGGYAEYVVADAGNAVRLPQEVSDEAAAALPCGVVTALHAIRRLQLALGETVAVVGAGGGVGVHALGLAALAGARVVAVTHSPAKVTDLRDAGADAVVAGHGAEVVAKVRETARGGVDAVVDCTGVTLPLSLRIVRSGGRVALLGNIDPGAAGFHAGLAILKEIDVLGSSHGTLDELETAVGLVRDGRVKPIVSTTFPLADAADAHRHVALGRTVGRTVLTLP